MSQPAPELLDQLNILIDKLRDESSHFQDSHEDTQQWYNRGYANGMVRGLIVVLKKQQPNGYSLDDDSFLQGHEVMAWGKAYRHGEQVGEKEIYEITGHH